MKKKLNSYVNTWDKNSIIDRIILFAYFAFCPFCYSIVAGRALYFWLFLLMTCFGIINIYLKRKIILDELSKSVIVLLFIYLLSLTYSMDKTATLSSLREFVLISVPIIIVCSVTYCYKSISYVRIIYWCSTFLFCYMILSQSKEYVKWNSRASVNLGTFELNQNFLAFFIIIPFTFFVYNIMRSSGKLKILKIVLLCIGIGVVMYSMLLTGSRTAIVGCAISFIIMIMMTVKQSKRKYMYISMTIVMVIIILFSYSHLIVYMPESIQNRLQMESFGNSNNRFMIWENVFSWRYRESNIINWLWGIGYGASTSVMGVTCHNMFLEILLENGPIVLFVYIFFIYKMSKKIVSSGNIIANSLWWSILCISMLMSGQICRFFWFDVLFVDIIIKQKKGKN